jgi:SAM-dependent methyltransferase
VSELQHPDSRSFERVADLYERVRPEYPGEILAWFAERLDLRRGRTVLDLGAGTGKLTRALVATGAHVIAVEPGDAMRAQLERAVPEAEAIAGGAEAIPLADGSVDAVTAGQSFHWFRPAEAVAEVHRVLRPGGGLALAWNRRDQDDELQREITELIAPHVPPGRTAVTKGGWHEALEQSGLFGPIEERQVRFTHELETHVFLGRILSVSFVASAPPDARASLERRLRELAAARGGRVEFRYLTLAYVTSACY